MASVYVERGTSVNDRGERLPLMRGMFALTISLPACSAYNELNREALVAAGEKLGLPRRISERELTRISRALLAAMDELVRAIRTDSAGLPEGSNRFLAGETRLLDAIRHNVTAEMLSKISSMMSIGFQG